MFTCSTKILPSPTLQYSIFLGMLRYGSILTIAIEIYHKLNIHNHTSHPDMEQMDLWESTFIQMNSV